MRAALQGLSKPYCGHCGYSLQGTGVGNRCPECGKFSDPEELVLWAYSSDTTVPLFSRAGGGWMLLIAFALIGVAFATLALGGRYVVWIGLCAFFPLMMAAVAYLGWMSLPPKWDLGGPYQVRINSAGYGARYGFGRVPRQPWYRDMSVHLSRAPRGLRNKVFRISRKNQWLSMFSFQLTVKWPIAEELAHQIGDWIEAAPKARDHDEREGHLVLIERSQQDQDDDA